MLRRTLLHARAGPCRAHGQLCRGFMAGLDSTSPLPALPCALLPRAGSGLMWRFAASSSATTCLPSPLLPRPPVRRCGPVRPAWNGQQRPVQQHPPALPVAVQAFHACGCGTPGHGGWPRHATQGALPTAVAQAATAGPIMAARHHAMSTPAGPSRAACCLQAAPSFTSAAGWWWRSCARCRPPSAPATCVRTACAPARGAGHGGAWLQRTQDAMLGCVGSCGVAGCAVPRRGHRFVARACMRCRG